MGRLKNTSFKYEERGYRNNGGRYAKWRIVGLPATNEVLLTNHRSAIIDSRLGWTCEDGGFMNIGLGKEDEVAKWGEMELPDTEANRVKVAELESRGFRTNFIYIKLSD